MRRVALAALRGSVSEVVCVDYFVLDSIKRFHAMDMYSRFSATVIVHDISLTTAVVVLETIWISQFWMPEYNQGDQAFNQGVFQKYLLENDSGQCQHAGITKTLWS